MTAENRAFAVALFALASAACGALLGLEPLDFPPGDGREAGSGDGAVDAATDAPALDAKDSGSDGDAAPGLRFCEQLDGSVDGGAVVFCDDFERAGPAEKGWASPTTIGGTLALTSETVSSGTQSLLVTIPAGASGTPKQAYLTTPGIPAAADHAVLELDYHIDIAPPATGSFIFARANSGGFKQLYVGTPADGASNPYFLVTDPVESLPTKAWYHLVWYVGLLDEWAEVTPKAGGAKVVRPTDDRRNPTSFWIGAETDPGQGPVRMFIDNVVVHR